MYKKAKRAFTLMEVIISLGLVAILASLFVMNLEPVLNSLENKSPEKLLSDVVNRASNLVQSRGEEIKLSFESDTGRFILSSYLLDEPLEYYEIDIEGLEVTFEVIYPKVVDGSASTFKRVEEVDSMRFSTDASSSKMRICMDYASRKYEVVFDPFSAIKLEDSDNEKD